MPAREPINLALIQPTETARFAEVVAFAKEFDHSVWSDRPVMAVKRGQRLVGYAQFITHPIGIPNWHVNPAICSPRDVLEGSAALRSWQQGNNAAGSVIIAVFDTDDRMNDGTLKRLGFRSMNARLYVSDDCATT